jgi:hypothetical protein
MLSLALPPIQNELTPLRVYIIYDFFTSNKITIYLCKASAMFSSSLRAITVVP